MKKILFFALLLAGSGFSDLCIKAAVKAPTSINSIEGENPLVVKIEMLYDVRVVKISFNGVHEGQGRLQVLDQDGKVFYQEMEIDLNPEPYYYAISCDELKTGDCTFVVITKTGVYKASIKI